MPRGVRLNPQHDERTRAKIQTSQIINRLQKFVKGEIEMTAPQVTAAQILLKKTLPDLAHNTHANDPENPLIKSSHEYTDAELAARIAGMGSATTIEAPSSKTKLN